MVATLCDFWGEDKLKRYLWCCNYSENTPHGNAHRQLFYIFQYLFVLSSNKEALWSIRFSWSQQPPVVTSLLPSLLPSLHSSQTSLRLPHLPWGTNWSCKEPEASFLRLLFKISGLPCSTQGLGNTHFDLFFPTLSKNNVIDTPLFKNKSVYIPNPCKFRHILYP